MTHLDIFEGQQNVLSAQRACFDDLSSTTVPLNSVLEISLVFLTQKTNLVERRDQYQVTGE